VFYDELAAQNGHYAVTLGRNMPHLEPSMLNVYAEVDATRVLSFIADARPSPQIVSALGRTYFP